MNAISAVIFFAILGLVLSAEYPSKYDNIDVDKILKNNRVLANYIKCLMDEGPCTPEGRELKKTLPDALANGCTKCNQKQKEATEKVIRHLMTKKARDWERLSKKYDPQGVYKQKYQDLIANTKSS